jgi:DNA-directed RNA polymerase specialized sigma24 family protein
MTDAGPGSSRDDRFATTRWSLVEVARGGDSPQARQAMAVLCETYWYPLYAYVRRSGRAPDEAQDLTQGFFASWLARDPLGSVTPDKGRFRSFLLASFKHYLSNQIVRDRTLKRGRGRSPLSIDLRDAEGRYVREPSHELTPDRLFARRWALTLLEQVLARLGSEMEASGKASLHDQLGPALLGSAQSAPYAQIAETLGMTEGAVKVAAHRMRQRYRELLVEEVERTVDVPGAVDEEIRDLFEALRR